MQYQDFIKNSLKSASEIANNYFGKVSGIVKEGDNNQVLTKADGEIGQFLIAEVKKQFPSHNIIDEEAGVIDNTSDYTWVIDPIDGTSNFANGIPTYAIMIGLLEKNIPIAGGVVLPYFSEIYIAEKGKDAFCNDTKVFVTKESNLFNTLVAYGIDGHQENPQITYDETKILTNIILKIRNLRSSNSAFDIMQVAKGGYGAWCNKTSKIWDNVAPQIIIEEAGGLYTDFYGKVIDYSNPLKKTKENFTVCCAPQTLHQQLQEIIHTSSLSQSN